IRYADFKTITRSRKLTQYTNSKEKILLIVTELFDQHWTEQPVRLIGVTVQDILYTSDIHEQLSLFTYNQSIKRNNLDMTVDELTKKINICDNHEQLSLVTYNKNIKKNNIDMTVAELTKKFRKDIFKTNKDENESSTSDSELFRTSFQKDFLNDYKNKKT